jgi:hypothetical protein
MSTVLSLLYELYKLYELDKLRPVDRARYFCDNL